VGDRVAYSKNDKITVNLDWCFLLEGKIPHGLAAFTYENPVYKSSSFTGVGVFTGGVLHGGPAMIIDGDG
jgi:hypothetical protein